MHKAYITEANRSDDLSREPLYEIKGHEAETVIALKFSHSTENNILDGWPNPRLWLGQYIDLQDEDNLYFAPKDQLKDIVSEYNLKPVSL